MPLFSYKAKDQNGREVVGKVPAQSEDALADRLTETGYFVMEIRAEKPQVMQQDIFEMFRGISSREYIMFLTHLYVALEAGLPLLKVLDTLANQVRSQKMAVALRGVLADVRGGLSFSAALAKYPKIFSMYFVSMVGVGEATGKLADSFRKLADFMEKDEELKRKMTSVFIYPVILITATLGAMGFLMTFVVPQFVTIFSASKVTLPLPTIILLAISNVVRNGWPFFIIGGVVAALGLRAFISTKSGRYAWDDFQLRIPLFGDISKKIYIVRFMNTLAILYSSGVSIGMALSLIEGNIGNAVFAKTVGELKVTVEGGCGIADGLSAVQLFPAESIMMIASGEETGKLPEMLVKTAELYEKETDYLLKTIGSLMEPMIIGVMGVIVGFVALGIMLPVFRMSTTVH